RPAKFANRILELRSHFEFGIGMIGLRHRTGAERKADKGVGSEMLEEREPGPRADAVECEAALLAGERLAHPEICAVSECVEAPLIDKVEQPSRDRRCSELCGSEDVVISDRFGLQIATDGREAASRELLVRNQRTVGKLSGEPEIAVDVGTEIGEIIHI